MKIVRDKPISELVTITVRIRRDMKDALDAKAKAAKLKREPLIRAILEQVLEDPKFVLRVKG